jgi:hypothetical protein
MPESASEGRARSTVCLSTVTSSADAPMASKAETAARGQRRRHDASPQAPIAAISGHFTHHADAARKTSVSGSQRNVSAKDDAAPSRARSASRTKPTSLTIAGYMIKSSLRAPPMRVD